MWIYEKAYYLKIVGKKNALQQEFNKSIFKAQINDHVFFF